MKPMIGKSIDDNQCHLIDWYRQSMNHWCWGFLWLSISSIINFYRLSMPIDQLVSKFKSQTFVHTAKCACVYAGTRGIQRFFNANWWQSMSFDNFCVIMDWSSMSINQQGINCHRLIDWFSDHRFHRLFKPWNLLEQLCFDCICWFIHVVPVTTDSSVFIQSSIVWNRWKRSLRVYLNRGNQSGEILESVTQSLFTLTVNEHMIANVCLYLSFLLK